MRDLIRQLACFRACHLRDEIVVENLANMLPYAFRAGSQKISRLNKQDSDYH
jgi:hypothetical protein